MQIKIKPLAIAISLILSACNSSDSNESKTNTLVTDNAVPVVAEPVIATTTLSGIVSDGYISGATVCLDINENSRCDAGEPVAISGEGGRYNLINIKQGDEAHSLIAVVGIDSQDADGRNFVNRTIFSAPKEHGGVISPISTLVHQKLKMDTNLTLEQAKNSVITELGLNISSAELLTDYIAKEVAELQAQGIAETKYRDMHRAAQLLTTLMGSELIEEKTSTNNFSDLDEGATFDSMVEGMLLEVDPETQKTIITEVKDKIEEEKDNSAADFTEIERVDLGGGASEVKDSTCAVPQAYKQDDDDDKDDNESDDNESDDNESDDNENGLNTGCNTLTAVTPVAPVAPVAPVTPVTPVVPSTAAGKALYASKSCSASSCHGVNPANGQNKISRAVSASVTRSAINSNKGGMGFLVGISDADLQAIADYVRNPQ